MITSIQRALLVAAAFSLPFAACGGKTIDAGRGGDAGSGDSSGSSSGSSGGSSSGGSSGSSGGSSGSTSGGGSGSSSGGSSGSTTSCVTIDPSTYDQSCNADPDCIGVTVGTICPGSCLCGGGTINASGQARYDAAVSGIMTDLCPCPPPPQPRCLASKCVICMGTPGDPPECGVTVHVDAGVVCTQTGPVFGSSGGDGGSCTFGASEACSDGTTYSVKCSCPDAMCSCSESFGMGGSSGGAPFAGCADSCSPASLQLAYEACGFPVPQH